MSVIIPPTVGRKVWFRHPGRQLGDQPWDATICHVNKDGTINIAYHDANGHPAAAQNIPLMQEEDKAPPNGTGYCEWMPYQQAQQAKAAAADPLTTLNKGK